MILAEIIYSIAVILAGYVVLHHYLNSLHECGEIADIRSFSRNRVLYLLFALVAEMVITAFAEGYYKDYSNLHVMRNATLLGVLLPMAAVDYRYKKIPNQFLIIGLIAAVLFLVLEFAFYGVESGWENLKDCLLGAVIMAAFFLLLALVFKQSLGMGDVKAFGLIGLYEGLWGAVSVVFYALIVSFFMAVFFLITKRKGKRDTIAFGPCILAGAILAICLNGI